MPDVIVETEAAAQHGETRPQHLPELRESVEQVLARIRSHIGAGQNAALAAHVVRSTPPRIHELSAFREEFIRCLHPGQEHGVRSFGHLLWRLLLDSSEPVRPAPAIREEVETLLSEARWLEGLCAGRVELAEEGCSPWEKDVLALVAAMGGILGALGDLLEQALAEAEG